ncbi:MAG TPA: class IV adenylate cyclase [Candidatus Acidoferrum sp.]|nr:class IV adenylate cyclase [Candidatus Acidoferrum sp.]
MARETEIKLRVEDVAALRKVLRRVGARTVAGGSGRVHEFNTLYDTPTQEVRAKDQLLRVRVETPALALRSRPAGRGSTKRKKRFVLTFKGPVKDSSAKATINDRHFGRNHKVREELELEIGDPKEFGAILERLGMRESFHYEKFRTTFRMPESQRWAKGLLIELDETPVGNFVELEGPAKAIDRAAKLLGFSKNDYVLTNYLRLHAEECMKRGEKIGDMLFRKRK